MKTDSQGPLNSPASRQRLPFLELMLAAVIVAGGCTDSSRSSYSEAFLPAGLEDPGVRISEEFLLEIDAERSRLTREYLEIHNPGVAAGLPEGNSPSSITFTPRLIVVHYTAIPSLQETMDYFRPNQIEGSREIIRRNGLLNVGIQFVVDRDGSIYRSYPETVIARHTIGLNHAAIGIENVGNGDLEDPQAEFPLTGAQLRANLDLIGYLAARYPGIEFMIGHQEYTLLEDPRHPAHHLFYEQFPDYRTEKSDPGDRFLKELRLGLQQRAAVRP